MSKVSGLGDQFYLNGEDMSGDVGSLSKIGGGPGLLTVTAINKYAEERVGGHLDGSVEFASWFNPYSAATPDKAWKLPTTNIIGTYFNGAAVGQDGASCVAKQLNWDGNRAADGGYAFACSLQANGFGAEWGLQHTAGKQLDAAPAQSAGLDSGAAGLSFGAQVYIHVFSVSGTSVTVKLQDFTTDTPGSYVDVAGLTSGAVTPAMCPFAIRVATPNNALVRRWTRVVTTGTFTNATFAVQFCRNLVAGMAW
jgi:hypothetical protein